MVSKAILAMTEVLITPMVDAFAKSYKEEILAEERQKGAASMKSNAIIDKEIEDKKEQFTRWILCRDEAESLERGFHLLMEELEKQPEYDRVMQEFSRAAEKLEGEWGEGEQNTPKLYESNQQMFGISNETFNLFYIIAKRYIDERKWNDACAMLYFLTNLNPFVCEPWLALGYAQMVNKNPVEALRCFSMASLCRFDDYMPHLYSANCYAEIGEKNLAQQTLRLAEKLMSAEEKMEQKKLINYLNNTIKKMEKAK